MTPDEFIQIFRLLDLNRLRKEFDKMKDEERRVVVAFLARCQRAPRT